jgi:zinc protease
VALLPKSTRGNRVHGQISMRIGNLESLSGQDFVPGGVANMLMRGSEQFSRQALRDHLDEIQSTLSISGDRLVSIGTQTRRDQVSALIEVVAEVLKNPTFPDSELAELRRQFLNGLDQQRDDPGSVANMALQRHFNRLAPEHPDYPADFDRTEARIRAVEREQLIEFHRSHYGFTPATTISFVGDFDADELRAALEAHFNDWASPTEYVRIDSDFEPTEAAQLIEQLDDKANAIFLARMSFPMNQDHPDYPAMAMAGHLLGGGFLSSRLSNRIRDDEGLSYAVGGGFNAGAIDEIGNFTAFAMYAPENRDRLIEVMFEELEKLIDEGFSAEELEAGRRGYLQQLSVLRSDDGRLNNILNTNLFLGRDIFHQAEYEARIAELTAEEVSEAVRRHFDPSQVSYSVAGDFDEGGER